MSSNINNRGIAGDLVKGMVHSPTLRACTAALLVSGVALGILFLLSSQAPPFWMVGAVGGGAAVGGGVFGVGIQLPFKGKQKMTFEFTTIVRLLKSKNYDLIFEDPATGHKLILGALPNRWRSEGERLVNEEGVITFLSLNEPWERTPVGLSSPYELADWTTLQAQQQNFDVLDHTLLNNHTLNTTSEAIKDALQTGNVYVHCRAGAGRSAMAVAAYLIRYQGKTVEEACETIKTQRPLSTIRNKKERLIEYAASLEPQGIEQLQEIAAYINDKGGPDTNYAILKFTPLQCAAAIVMHSVDKTAEEMRALCVEVSVEEKDFGLLQAMYKKCFPLALSAPFARDIPLSS